MTNKQALELALITLERDNLKAGNIYINYDIQKALIKLVKKKLEKKQKDIPNNLPIANPKEDEPMYPPQREPVLPGGGGGSGVPTINGVSLYRKPSGSWTSWDNTMCNPLANARMQTQSAWADGYDSAKAEWVGLTEDEVSSFGLFHAVVDEECVRAIEKLLKEKNCG